MELAFLSAVEQARLVRSGELSSTELVRAPPRADRAARSDAELVRHGLRRRSARGSGARRRDAGRRAVPRRSDRDQGSGADRGHPHDVLVARVRRLRPGLRQRRRPADPRGRVRHRRQDEHAGVRNGRVHRVGAERRDPEPVEHRADAGWLERRRGGSARSGPRAGRPRDRRRRLDPHPRVLLRPLRAQAVARARLERAVRFARGPLDRRAAHAYASRTPPISSTSSPATSRAIRGGRRRPSGRSPRRWPEPPATPPDRRDIDSARSTCPSIPSASPRSPQPQPCSPSWVTTCETRHRHGASPDLFDTFIAVWQVGPALHPVEDMSLLTPLNRGLVESAHAEIRSRLWTRRCVAADARPPDRRVLE